jgi:hypothetical protein
MKCGIALDEFLCTIAVDISVRLSVRMQLLRYTNHFFAMRAVVELEHRWIIF